MFLEWLEIDVIQVFCRMFRIENSVLEIIVRIQKHAKEFQHIMANGLKILKVHFNSLFWANYNEINISILA